MPAYTTVGPDGAFELRVGDSSDLQPYVDALCELYERDGVAVADASLQQEYREIFSADKFRDKLVNMWSVRPNFRLVTLWLGDDLAGFICGSSLPAGRDWWRKVVGNFSDEFTLESGSRTLHITQFVVKASLRGRHLGSIMHEALLDDRPEERVTLLSEPQLQPAYSIYLHWGYQKVGTSQPAPNETTRDLLTRPRVLDQVVD